MQSLPSLIIERTMKQKTLSHTQAQTLKAGLRSFAEAGGHDWQLKGFKTWAKNLKDKRQIGRLLKRITK